MRINKKFYLFIISSLFVLTFSISAQNNEQTETDFGLGLMLGVETFDSAVAGGDPETFQSLALKPDLAIGKFGIGLDLVLHYRFVSDSDSVLDIREEDWIPQEGQSFLSLYLPKITYLSWGSKGDNIYAKLGQIEDASLGTGFIVSNYSNTLFQPDEQIVGLNFDIDGQLFEFPYVGIETFAGNLAHFDVFGGRVYARPMLWSGVPVIKDLEWGITVAADVDPDFRSEFYDSDENNGVEANAVVVFGTDLILPVLNFNIATLSLFGDFSVQGSNTGGMVGFGGRLVSIIPYIFQLRILGDNFIPSYFDNTYDIYRGVKYDLLNYDGIVIPASLSWLASTGVSILDDLLVFNATIDGPFKAVPTGDTADYNYLEYPHLNAVFLINEGLIPDFSFSASYDKKFIAEFADIIEAEDAMINMAINYNAGAAVITLSYDMLYIGDENPNITLDDFDVSSSLSCSIELF